MGTILCTPKVKPRERILETARKLFRRHGLKGIGVEAIAEAAETNKMTLYRHFGSKDDLITECLREVACKGEQIWADLETAHPGDPLAQVHGWVRLGADFLKDGRGCDLANAAVELSEGDHPAKRVIQDFKLSQRNRLAALCEAAALKNPGLVADTLSLLFEGARINRQSIGEVGPTLSYVAAAEAIINAARG